MESFCHPLWYQYHLWLSLPLLRESGSPSDLSVFLVSLGASLSHFSLAPPLKMAAAADERPEAKRDPPSINGVYTLVRGQEFVDLMSNTGTKVT